MISFDLSSSTNFKIKNLEKEILYLKKEIQELKKDIKYLNESESLHRRMIVEIGDKVL